MRRKFDHDLARELYRGGALIESLAVKFRVSEQAIRFAVLPGEAERQRKRREWRLAERRRLEALRDEGVHKEV